MTVRIGMLTPSSNTALEPACAKIAADLEGVSVHFSRLTVTRIDLTGGGLQQFDDDRFVAAARLLADAHVDAIVWNGTSGAWLGLEADRRMCAAITSATGIPASTSVLALAQLCRRAGVRRLGLATPYIPAVQARVDSALSGEVGAVSSRSLGISVNDEFSRIPPERIEQMVAELAADGCDVISTFCTNMHSAPHAGRWSATYGVPIFDTTVLAMWAGVDLAGADASPLTRWGLGAAGVFA